ncbi:hypothetical protein ACFPVT_03590 [Corynebacterium choanae]|uniref:hypothetical protein n=1 Tax=Corynebacterium choanae TaxID=1862358 RepID=UPI0013DDC09D|nr:hypothetical protein [Corynebacterium choanae]
MRPSGDTRNEASPAAHTNSDTAPGGIIHGGSPDHARIFRISDESSKIGMTA